VPLFGKGGITQKRRVVPRPPGDTTPLPPGIAEALRKAGMDPDKFTLAPGDGGATPAHLGLPPAGGSLEHTFLFTDRADALHCVDAFSDRGRPVTIAKDADGWWVTINGADDPTVADDEEHRRIAAEVAALGGQDRGLGRMTVTTNIRVK